uniref:Uncharacterized protein n=1 Tax=Cannabis sativa TaxID=3483 RepID=A0A803P1L3_CANSA
MPIHKVDSPVRHATSPVFVPSQKRSSNDGQAMWRSSSLRGAGEDVNNLPMDQAKPLETIPKIINYGHNQARVLPIGEIPTQNQQADATTSLVGSNIQDLVAAAVENGVRDQVRNHRAPKGRKTLDSHCTQPGLPVGIIDHHVKIPYPRRL